MPSIRRFNPPTDPLTAAVQQSTDPTPVLLGRQAWTYDAAGNRTAAQQDDAVQASSFDVLNRLTARQAGGPLVFEGTVDEPATVTIDGRPASVDPTNAFRGTGQTASGTTTVTITARDGAGNTATQAYEVDVTGGSTAYTHDANGNLTSDGVQTYQWNARNELIRVQAGGVDVATFTYDGFGRRVTKTAGGVTTTYVYDAEDIVEARRSTGDVVRFVHGPGIDQVLARTTNGADAVYYLTDHLGSVVQEVDATEAVVLDRAYDPWGVPVQGGATSGYAFTGREWDAETGLYYYRARYYQPATGQFLSEDPIRLQGGPNYYSYVSGRPLAMTDPLGLCMSGPDPDLSRLLEDYRRLVDWLSQNIDPRFPRDINISEAGVPDARRMAMRAAEIIAKELKGSVRAVFPQEMMGKTLAEITDLAKQGNKAAQTARKLLTQKDYRK